MSKNAFLGELLADCLLDAPKRYAALPQAQRLEMQGRLRQAFRPGPRFTAGDCVAFKHGWHPPIRDTAPREFHFVRYLRWWDWRDRALVRRSIKVDHMPFPPDCIIACVDFGEGKCCATMFASHRLLRLVRLYPDGMTEEEKFPAVAAP